MRQIHFKIHLRFNDFQVCWSKEDLNLLIARRLVQDLIPRKIPRDFPALYTYLKDVIETVKAKSNEKNLHVTFPIMYTNIFSCLRYLKLI